MIEFLTDWVAAVWIILSESGPYLLVGFAIAGLIKVLIPEEKVFRHLGRDDFRSVFLSSCVGVPIPLCSCSVIPTATALRKSGASKGATTSFLISTPETGVDSIGVTWALMDPVMTIVRPLAALVTALGAGTFVNLLVRRGWDDQPDRAGARADGAECACAAPGESGGDPSSCLEIVAPAGRRRRGLGEVLRATLRYAFGPLMADLTPWFVLGFIISGVIMVVTPDDFFGSVLPAGWTWVSMLVMLVAGVPMYICATASTPVAAALMAKGLDPGAALVLLLAGPATNVATFFVVKNMLGRRILAVYLTSIALFSLVLGGLINGVYSILEIVPSTSLENGEPSAAAAYVHGVCGVALGLLLLYHAVDQGIGARFGRWVKKWGAHVGVDPTSRLSRAVCCLAVLCLYGTTAYTVVGPGEVGFRVRFGKVCETYPEPGIHGHWPYPFERVEVVRDDQVRRTEFAPPQEAFGEWTGVNPPDGRDYSAESEIVTGDENIVSIVYSVQYAVADAYRFRFGVEDSETLVRAFAESTLRQVLCARPSDEILVADREELQGVTGALLQRELDAAGAGVRVVAFKLLDVHSPPQTHWAYRDVASAHEYKLEKIRAAEGYQLKTTTEARADAYRIEQEAASDRTIAVNRAGGDVAAFLKLLTAIEGNRRLTELRLWLEATERAYQGVRIVLVLDEGIEIRVYRTEGAGERQDLPLEATEER